MIGVVIVEDELLVRLGMKTILQQSDAPIEVLQDFSTAQEALAYFGNNTADVLITDIRLPGMTGLEMVSKLGNQHHKMKKIVLSCLESFEYAREAYELGVDKYILKHELEEDEMPEIVMQLYGGEMGQQGLYPMVSTERLTALQGGSYLMIGFDLLADSLETPQPDMDMVANLLLQLPDSASKQCIGSRQNGRLILLLSYSELLSEKQAAEEAEKFFQKAHYLLGNYITHFLFMVASDPFEEIGKISEIERSIQQAMEYAFYCHSPKLFMLSSMPRFAQEAPVLCWEPKFVLTNDEKQKKFYIQLQNYFIECRECLYTPDSVRVGAAAFLYQLNEWTEKLGGCGLEAINGSNEYPPNHIGVQKIKRIALLQKWLLSLLEQAVTAIEGQRKSKGVINKIVAYLQNNYQLEITLDSLAEEFHISPAYLSALFHKETGQTFTRYLGDVRINNAMKLLEETQLSIEQVGREVGFNNSNYFFRSFKKATGLTAGEYRKQKYRNKS